MAHVPSEKAAASMTMPAVSAGTGSMMGSGMGTMGKMAMEEARPMAMGGMMGGMGSGMMGGMGSGMMEGMGPGMAEMMSHSAAPALTTGAMVAARNPGGGSALGKVLQHPLVLLGVGFALGYLIHKYRKEIISTFTQAPSESE